MRYTAKDARNAFELLAEVLGKPTGDVWSTNGEGKNVARVGVWYLEVAHRKYRVAEIASQGGSEVQPLGYWYRNAREFVMACEFAREAIRVYKENQKGNLPG